MTTVGTSQGMRIAAYGLLYPGVGSVIAANFTLLERLLQLGFRIDYYSIKDFADPGDLVHHENFHFIPIERRWINRLWPWILSTPKPLRRFCVGLTSQFSLWIHERAIHRVLQREHERDPYKLLLVLGLLSPFRVPDLPCISWPQGAPNGEWDAIRSQRSTLIAHSGRMLYEGLRTAYAYKMRRARALLPNSDALICGSRWSRENWIRLGMPAESVHAIPYPFDLSLFHTECRPAPDPHTTTFLWLGRIVPRKRLDLLLDAFALLRQERRDVRLKIIGKFDYGKEFAEQTLRRYGPDDGVEYRPSIPPQDVPDLMRRVDVLVQPSENEDIGSAVLEAQACGTSVIVGPTNGTRDYISPESVVFDEYTPESLKRAMTTTIERLKTDREGLIASARATVEHHIHTELVVERVLNLFDAVIASREGGQQVVSPVSTTP